MKLFPRDKVIGIFRGFSEGGLEFHADLVLPYKNEFQSTPMHGQFLVVQLEHEDEAVLGRITSLSARGRLASGAGEDYGIRAVNEGREVPEDLREQYLKYQVNIRVLGVLRMVAEKLEFAPSHRRLPHVGSKVAFLSDEVLMEVAGHNLAGAELGYFALGEFIYSGKDANLEKQPWMQVKSPAIIPKFHAKHLVSRRSLVFARAGYGKSNLIKLLFSNLYKDDPTVEKRKGRHAPVGTLIFDPDGEYFWPDDKNRPGLCDVPELESKVVVFTPRRGPSPFYQSFVGGDIKLDIRRLRPADVISIALSPDRQDQQNVRKLKGLNQSDWRELVDEIARNGNDADEQLITRVMRLRDGNQDYELLAARANMTQIVRMLHDPSSQMMDMLFAALKAGKICVIDVSQMRGTRALVLSGLILQQIFDHNQNEFTKAEPETIPVLAVVEEAQSVLGSGGSSGEGPYISWVKEGRKYDLGAVLITQQPGSISHEILSQGDNWFIFHLLSAGDLMSVKKANAHFSDDLLSALLNEPIPGHGVFWSSAGGKSYPVPIRVLSFERMVTPRDPEYRLPPAKTFAQQLRQQVERDLANSRSLAAQVRLDEAARPRAVVSEGDGEREPSGPVEPDVEIGDQPVDALDTHVSAAIHRVGQDQAFLDKLRSTGQPWGGIKAALASALPTSLEGREQIAYDNVERLLNELFGSDGWKRERRPRANNPSQTTVWVVQKGAEKGTS